MTDPDDERLTITFDPPSPYDTLQTWIAFRAWLVAEFGDRPIGAPYIRSADETIAYIRARGDPFADAK